MQRLLLDERTSWVRETEELCTFIESFARGVVDRTGDDREPQLFVELHQERVAARDHDGEVREQGGAGGSEPDRILRMHGDER